VARAVGDPLLELMDELQQQHEQGSGFKFDVFRVLGASLIVWVATTAIAILLPIMYGRASTIIS